MAAKLILSMDGMVLREYVLNKERMTIGRKPHNDVVIDNLAVSGEHAAVVTILNDSFLEDLDSTNGVSVNGVSIKKHFLQANDLIEIGKYKLKYVNEQQAQQPVVEDFERTMIMRVPVNKPQPGVAEAEGGKPTMNTQSSLAPAGPHEATGKFATTALHSEPQVNTVNSPNPLITLAVLQILNGSSAGRELDLVKNLTTLGKPGVQVAVLTRRPHGYFITHVEGGNYPTVNGKTLNEQPQQLNNHDIIELAGVKMEFYLKD